MMGDSHAPAIVLEQRPVVAAQYRDEKAGYDAYVIRPYMEPQLVIDDAIDKICTSNQKVNLPCFPSRPLEDRVGFRILY